MKEKFYIELYNVKMLYWLQKTNLTIHYETYLFSIRLNMPFFFYEQFSVQY